MESILTSIKKLIGISEEYTHFDADIIMHINSVFMTLNQLGVGPPEGFRIEDKYAIWEDFSIDVNIQNSVKSYMYLKVRLIFDSANLSSAVIESINNQIKEFEWRLNVAAESNKSSGEEENQNG